jgi:hypothetical protein
MARSLKPVYEEAPAAMKNKDKEHTQLSARTSRRKFTKSVAATLVAAPLAARLAQAQQPSTTKQAPAPPKPQPTPTPAAAVPSPVVEAYLAVARARFGEHLAPEQFEQLKKDIEGNVRSADRLRAVKLKNGDEPDFIFSA